MQALKGKSIAIIAALGAAFAFFTAKARAEESNVEPPEPSDADARVQAFLHMIRVLETGSSESYDVFYGGSRFRDFSDHPVITGEKSGVPLSPAVCRAAGFLGDSCVSTAAGAYQINKPTWLEFGAGLPDFSPESQDEAAIRLLRKTGALDALIAGDFDTALHLASKRWASLPFSTAQQNPKSYAYALSHYLDYLEA